MSAKILVPRYYPKLVLLYTRTMENTYKVPEQNLEKLKAQIAKLAARCRRVKIQEPVLTVGEYEDVVEVVRDEEDQPVSHVRRVYMVTLVSEGRPKIAGYEFAAVISSVTDEDGHLIGNVLRQVPGFEGSIPESCRDATNYCDHCKTHRRRLETFLIYSATGYRQIGRNCLGYYLGLTDPERYANIAELILDTADLMSMAEEDGFGGSGPAPRVLMTEILENTASVIRLYGWLSNKSAREFDKTSTSTRVREWVFSSSKDRKQWDPKVEITAEDKLLAANTLDWLNTIDPQTDNDYMYNLSLLAKSISVTGKNFGIVCSAINAYSKETEFQIRRNAQIETDSKSEFIGTEGERRVFENLLVVYTMSYENEFGITHLYKMKLGDNLVVYFSSRDMGWTQGETIPSITATIKKHETRVDKYNPEGTKQTIITRASLSKESLTEEQKQAKKGALKLRRAIKKAGLIDSAYEANAVGRPEDYDAYCTLSDLRWQIEQEAL